MDDTQPFDFRRVELPPVPKVRRGPLAAVAVVILGGLLAYNTLYQVQPEEVGVVLRFGRYVGTTDPGLRVKLPVVDEVRKVPVQRQLKQEFGFRTVDADIRTTYAPTDRELEGETIMLTGDLNVAVVEWIVQYRCRTPISTSSRCVT